MHDSKTDPPRPSFWCGILTADKQAAKPASARTIRGHCTSFNPAIPQRMRMAPSGVAGEEDEDDEKG